MELVCLWTYRYIIFGSISSYWISRISSS
jgi:hypothetical protein